MESSSNAAESVRKKMESLRSICDTQIPTNLHKMESFTASFCNSLDSILSTAQQSLRKRGKLEEMKSKLQEAEDDFVKVLTVKTRKEAKQMAMKDSVSAARARVEELYKILQAQRARRDEYAAILSEQSLCTSETLGEKGNQGIECKEDVQEAIFWYNKVLGFHIEGGRGVKFTFNNIKIENPCEEYFFTIRYENDMYTLLACDPHLGDTKELIHDLNRTNGLYKFVRIMREKFQEAASLGTLPQPTILRQESSAISVSAPVLSVSSDRSESPVTTSEHSLEEVKRNFKRANYGRRAKQVLLSPASVRRSPRFKPKK